MTMNDYNTAVAKEIYEATQGELIYRDELGLQYIA